MSASKTGIEWTDATWNPVTGCSHVSPGCEHCYAEKLSHRFGWTRQPWGAQHAAENVRLHPERLDQPLRWRRPRRIFVNSMSDLFHPGVPFEFVDRVWATMALAPRHVFQVLTKRADRMAEYLTQREDIIRETVAFEAARLGAFRSAEAMGGRWEAPQFDGEGRCENCGYFDGIRFDWPLPNVWLGVSVEDQQRADERLPHLLRCPAAVRFVSAEPLLGALEITEHLMGYQDDDVSGGGYVRLPHRTPYIYQEKKLHWIIVGGESGPGARPMHPDWARSLVRQCKDAGTACFVKQMGSVWAAENGARNRKGGDLDEWPDDLRVREFPEMERCHA